MTHPVMPYALAAAARGWHVFPLAVGGKQPLKGFASWERNATTEPGRIRSMWATHQPYNVGIACGPSGLVVLDMDVPKPGDQPPSAVNIAGINDGADALALLCEHHEQPLPLDTFTVRTRRGGLHLYFTVPKAKATATRLGNTAGHLGWLIDTRAHGGYVVGPGSHVATTDGAGTYQVTNKTAPAPLPDWLAERLAPPPRPPQEPVNVPMVTGRHGGYLRSAVAAELDRVTASPPHEHNNALYRASVALGQLVAGGMLTEEQVTTWLAAAADQVGQPTGEARRTIASGLAAGSKRPRRMAA